MSEYQLTNKQWREFQAIPEQGYSHRAWVDARIAEAVSAARTEGRERCTPNVRDVDRAAFALYKHEHLETVAESWEMVGLPIVLEYRDKAQVVVAAAIRAVSAEQEDHHD